MDLWKRFWVVGEVVPEAWRRDSFCRSVKQIVRRPVRTRRSRRSVLRLGRGRLRIEVRSVSIATRG